MCTSFLILLTTSMIIPVFSLLYWLHSFFWKILYVWRKWMYNAKTSMLPLPHFSWNAFTLMVLICFSVTFLYWTEEIIQIPQIWVQFLEPTRVLEASVIQFQETWSTLQDSREICTSQAYTWNENNFQILKKYSNSLEYVKFAINSQPNFYFSVLLFFKYITVPGSGRTYL